MANRKLFPNSVKTLPEATGLTPEGLMKQDAKPEHLKEELSLLFSLKAPDAAQAEFEHRVSRGERILSEEQNEKYAPDGKDVKVLVNWLQDEGFRITKVTKSGHGVYTRATAQVIQDALRVKIVRITKDGLTYTAAENAPSLPEEIAGSVHAIIGLQPYRQANKNSVMRVPAHGNRIPAKAANTIGAIPSPAIADAPPYIPSEILGAYNADNVGANGNGQTIAILIDTFPNDSDLTAFWQNTGSPATMAQISKINVTGQNLPLPEGEETLDTQWASGIASGADIRIYATSSLQFADLDQGLDQIVDDIDNFPGMRQLSISLGLGETFMVQDEVDAQHLRYVKLAGAGVNIFVSSGDAGSNPDQTGHNPTGPVQAEHPSSDPFVIGVGGTSLQLQPGGAISEEDAWVSSGGGQSIFFQQPAWQAGNNIPAGGPRLVPDVSLTADPDLGAYIFINGGIKQIGGTSWSAPVWAAFCAIINEARISAGKQALTFLNPLIYPLMSTPCFRDIQNGSNGAWQAGPGYDMVTGIGVPDVQELINTLP